MERKSNKPKVLMIGADKDGNGGVSSVVNQYYNSGLDSLVDLKYIPTMKEGNKLKKILIMMKALAVFMKSIKEYDILHVHMSSRNSFYRKRIFINIAKRKNKKIIIHMHGSEFDVFFEEECNERQKGIVRQTFSLANAVIVLSEGWKEFIGKICSQDRIIVIHNAVEFPRFERNNYREKRVLFLGRLCERKGVFDLIQAIPQVIKKIPDVQFYLGGDGEIEDCKKQCKMLGIENNVVFLGWINGEAKADNLKTCSTFILPSYHEGLPMALLEAMSYGEVVISTAVGGIPEVIQDDINGYIIEAGNIEEISQRLVYVLTAANREAIGKAAQNTIAEDFNIKKNIYKLLLLYEKLLSNKC